MVTSTYIRTYMHMIYLDFLVLLAVRHEKQSRFAHFSALTSDIANRIDYSTPYELEVVQCIVAKEDPFRSFQSNAASCLNGCGGHQRILQHS